ncbi:MAG: DNA-protecting protein DprA [Bdellovibrionaceae bacterium]|nr:DNA-protecting protein DprA [Pseudobdellovibrionaceae bacterium]
MDEISIAFLASFLADVPAQFFDDLKEVLAGGVPPRSAARELSHTPLRFRLEEEPEIWEAVERASAWCAERGAQVVYPGHAAYPEGFARLHAPPRVLSLFGSPCWRDRSGLSIVGSREPTRAALDWLDTHLTAALKDLDTFTVSGGARGVDQRAHSLSLRVGVPTVAFIPAGLAMIYPPDFADWTEAIVSGGGAIVTEFAPHEEMRKPHFHRRNRLIAALGVACLVAEAARKSGSLITARQAIEAGVPLATLPNSPMEPRASGSLDLLFDGAQLLRDARDLVEFVRLSSRPGAD